MLLIGTTQAQLAELPLNDEDITPLYPGGVKAALIDLRLYAQLSLIDAIRVGKTRERQLAIQILRKQLLNEEYTDQPTGNYTGS